MYLKTLRFLSTLACIFAVLQPFKCDELLLTPQISNTFMPYQPQPQQPPPQQPSIFQQSNIITNSIFSMGSNLEKKVNEDEVKGLADDTLELLKRQRYYNYPSNMGAQQPSSTQLAVTMALTNNIIPPSPVFSFVGCYNDRRELRDINDKDFSYLTKLNKSLPTVELCVQLCAQDGYKIAAVQAFDECYCGNTYGRYNATENSNCFFQCAGKYTCGGYNANSVYYISNVAPKVRDSEPSLALDIANPCLSSPCLNSGMCITIMDDKGIPRKFICRCTNPQDSGVFCEERNFCMSSPCLNGGTCTNNFNGYKCTCLSTWSGVNCHLPTDIALLNTNCFDESKKCLNGGSCTKADGEYYYSCKCPPFYSGPSCENYDACANNPCLNDGICIFKPPSYFECNCTNDNYYGFTCEKPNPCKNVKCANDGVCRINFSNNDYFCSCSSPNFIGKFCEQCKPQFTGPNCDQCVQGYMGINCDQPATYCNPNPCINGVCLWDTIDYRCICSEGWKGKNCTEKNCLLQPCLNEGICSTRFSNVTDKIEYFCSCPNGYIGEQCEHLNFDPCLSNPCSNGEDCMQSTDGTLSYVCVSSTNFCERMKPCNNNSECIYTKENNTFYCRCLNGAANCDSVIGIDVTVSIGTSSPKQIDRGDLVKSVQADNKHQADIPKLGFNFENLYWLLPLGLVILVVMLFLSIVTYFGLKARSRTAKFNKKPTNIRNIHYVNDNLTFDEHLKPIPSVSNSSITYSNRTSSDKEYTEGYGRV